MLLKLKPTKLNDESPIILDNIVLVIYILNYIDINGKIRRIKWKT